MNVTTTRPPRRVRALAACLAATAAWAATIASPWSPTAHAAPTVDQPTGQPTAVALPTAQTDGVVWSVAVVGNTVYAGGRFDHVRPAGTAVGDPAEVVRHNLMAFNLTTGELLPWAPDVEGQTYTSATAPDKFCKTVATNTYDCDSVFRIKASPDGSKIFVGGDFNTIDGQSRPRIAAFNTATGALDTSFKPQLNGRVRGLAITGSTVYVGGSFTSVNSTTTRTRLAAFDYSGTLLSWAPSADKSVWSMTVAPALNRVIIGGWFDTINTTSVHGLMAVDATSGAEVSWATRAISTSSIVTDLVNDGTAVYASGYNYQGSAGTARVEGRLAVNMSDGVVRWVDGCYGDTQSVTVMNGVVYGVSHEHDCTQLNVWPQQSPTNYQRLSGVTTTVGETFQGTTNALVTNAVTPLPSYTHFLPDFDGGPSTSAWKNGPWAVDNNGTYLVVGGEFLTVNGGAQQSLVRFAVPPVGPKTSAPKPFDTPVPTVQSDGSVRVSFPDTYDRDSTAVTYQLVRSDDTSTPVASMTLRNKGFWNLRTDTLVDRTLPAGVTVQYKLRAIDPDGNVTGTLWSSSVTGTGIPTVSRYAKKILSDAPAAYWRMGDTSGSTLRDTAAADDLTKGSGVTFGATGVVTDETDKAATFNGTSNGNAYNPISRYAPETFSEEVWFKTTTSQGGQLIGWGSSQTGSSSSTDRKLYLDNSGRVYFGVYPGVVKTINSASTYRDGNWHHTVATLGNDGMKLYVDGALVASDATVTRAQWRTGGYWRIGGDNISSSWTSRPTSSYINGTLDEVAVYNTALTASQVAAHFTAKSPAAPTASFTLTCTGLTCAVNGTGSSTPNGGVTGYSWNFGDGTTATAATATHTYAANGTYTVTLTITDSSSQTATTSQSVSVTNAAPSADFTLSCTARTCSVDSSPSTDSDGTIASSAWNFGDGATGTGTTASHTYAADGSYSVTLTVTDNKGATGVLTRTASVTGAAPTAAFTNSCTNLSCSFDAGSTQAGTAAMTGYNWNYGDGSTDSGVTTSHTFAASGIYTVTLTVTDADGKTGTATKTVQVTAAVVPGTIASDGFVRSVSNGWGSADVGGAWTVASTASNYAVSGGSATMTVPTSGSNRSAVLGSVAVTDVDQTVEASLSALPSAGSNYVYVIGRQVAANTDYRARVRLQSDGSVRLQFVRRAGSTTDTLIGSETLISGLSAPAGSAFKVRFQATGTSPTTLRAKVWAASGTEPASWQVTVTDSTAALQAAGAIGLGLTVSSSNTAVPVTATWRTYSAVTPA